MLCWVWMVMNGFLFLDKVIMPQRKVWSEQEDKVLRLLREEREQRKWANIARIMQVQFGIAGRTGKQCRQRYHNHLDSGIVHSEWSKDEQRVLYEMHEDIGNKWSIISQKLPGRSDNCVKNHFYSKLRKALRWLNKIISDYFSSQHKLIRESVLSRILKTTESKFKTSTKIDQQLADFCNTIKNRLFRFCLQEGDNFQDVESAQKLIVDIERFDKDYKKGYKGLKKDFQYEYKTYLKPPEKTLKKNSSTLSDASEKSEDSSSSFLSSSCFSCSDISEYDQLQVGAQMNSTGSKSLGTASGRNSSDISKSDKVEEKRKEVLEGSEMYGENIMKPQTFAIEYENLIEVESDFYNERDDERNIHYENMICDDTPVLGRILGPSELQSPFSLFGRENENENEDIQFKLERMEL